MPISCAPGPAPCDRRVISPTGGARGAAQRGRAGCPSSRAPRPAARPSPTTGSRAPPPARPGREAPGGVVFRAAVLTVRWRVRLGVEEDGTSEYCHWHVPEAHPLESWGDARAFDGTASLMQPLIEPLYGGKTAPELLSAILD